MNRQRTSGRSPDAVLAMAMTALAACTVAAGVAAVGTAASRLLGGRRPAEGVRASGQGIVKERCAAR
jgi:hypothetical protein